MRMFLLHIKTYLVSQAYNENEIFTCFGDTYQLLLVLNLVLYSKCEPDILSIDGSHGNFLKFVSLPSRPGNFY